MVLKLYGNPISVAVRRLATVLHEKQVPFEFVFVDILKAEHKQPEYLKKHPFGQVPYIDDDGFILYESRAIARYIATKYAAQGTQLIPSTDDLRAYALYDQASSVEMADFDKFAIDILRELVFKPIIGAEPIQAIVDDRLPDFNASLSVLDSILGRQKYMGGNQVTLVDIFYLPVFNGLVNVGAIDLTKRPNLARWWNEVSSRPAWLAVRDDVVSIESY